MNNPTLQHPNEADLMRFLDGELAGREARAIRRHTDSCWQCRRDLNEMQTAIDAYLRVRDAAAYPPPQGWGGLQLPVPEERRVWPVWCMALAVCGVFAGVAYLRPMAPAPVPMKSAPVVAPAPLAAISHRPREQAP